MIETSGQSFLYFGKFYNFTKNMNTINIDFFTTNFYYYEPIEYVIWLSIYDSTVLEEDKRGV